MAFSSYAIHIDDDTAGNCASWVIRSPAVLAAGGTRLQTEWYDAPIQSSVTANISNTTNATPIVITLQAALTGLVTGDIVYVTGHLGNLAANGNFKVTVSGTSVTLQNSVGSGNGTINTGTVKELARTPNKFQAAYAGVQTLLADMAAGN